MYNVYDHINKYAEDNELHRQTMIDDARKNFPEISYKEISDIVDVVIENSCE